MATASDSNVLCCAICFGKKIDRNPRGLPCQHSFCLDCLEQWQAKRVKDNNAYVECPVCRQVSRLPVGGISSLPVDFKVSEVADIMAGLTTEYKCQTCTQSGLSAPIKAICKTCNKRLCVNCTASHKQVKLFSSHEIVEELCADHKSAVEYFCLTCMERLCTICVINKHKDHELTNANSAEKDIKARLAGKLKLLDHRLNHMEKDINDKESVAQASEKYAEEFAERCLKDIKAFLDQHFTAVVQNHKIQHQRVVKELYENHREAVRQGRNLKESGDRLLRSDKLKNQEEYLREIDKIITEKIATTSYTKIVPEGQGFSRRNVKCAIKEVDAVKKAILSCKLSCDVSSGVQIRENIAGPNLVLEIPCGTDHDIESPGEIRIFSDASALVMDELGIPRQYDINGQCVHEFRCYELSCVSVYEDDVYFVPSRAKYVMKYSRDGYQESYRMDPPLEDVHQINIDGDAIFVLSVATGIEQRCLSNSNYRQVIVTSRGICHFWPVDNSGSGTLFYCTNQYKHVIEVYKKCGQWLYNIGDPGKSDLGFNVPCNIKVLSNGNIIVMDHKNDRIVELKTDGTFVRHILTERDGLYRPLDMDYISPYLWVSHIGKAQPQVLLFKFE